jgi:hypothetical protein
VCWTCQSVNDPSRISRGLEKLIAEGLDHSVRGVAAKVCVCVVKPADSNLERSGALRPLDCRAMVRLSVVQLLPALNGGGVERGTLEIARGAGPARASFAGGFRRWDGWCRNCCKRRQRASGVAHRRQVAAGPCAGFDRYGVGWPSSASIFCTLVLALAGLGRLGWLGGGMNPADAAPLRHYGARVVFGFPL